MISAGTRFGPYEIVGELGAGGMGEVYRARDTRLGRDVAIKILPAALTEHPDARQRFEREARAISSLNHPHVCTLYDVGRQDGTDFLVMEFLDGETFARRLEKGPLPTPDLLRIAIEIADALEKAHRHGILHRDLKPLNIMLTKSGAKLMDFGLAKPTATPPAATALSMPTRTTPLTAEGAIVGTFQYMAPEQLEGQEADVRSDLFSFGAVMYEMATGKRAFDGKTTASVIAAVLERDPPPIANVQPMSPPALERIVKTCLAKHPDERFQSAHDVKLELEWIRDAHFEAPASASSLRRANGAIAAWTAAAVLAIVAVALGYRELTRTVPTAPVVVAHILPPANASFALWGVSAGAPALSPDGTQLAFVAQTSDGSQPLWVQRLDGVEAHPIEGTDGASFAFWSPDSRSLGYFKKGQLYRVDVSAGLPVALAAVGAPSGGSWGSSGMILVGSNIGTASPSILRVAASGGAIEKIPMPGASFVQMAYPQFLPDGRHFLFSGLMTSDDSGSRGLYAGSLDGGAPQFILRTDSRSWYAAPGYLLFVRNGTLMAQPFDPAAMKLSGEPTPIADDAQLNPVTRSVPLAVADNGTLVYDSPTPPSSRIVWYDRQGTSVGATGAAAAWGSPSLSPDGRRLAISCSDANTGSRPDIWIYDLARDVKTRVTAGPGHQCRRVLGARWQACLLCIEWSREALSLV